MMYIRHLKKRRKKCCGGELQTTGVTLAYWLSAPSTPTPTSTPPQPQQPPLTHPPSYPYTTHISNYGLNTWMLKIKIFVGWSKKNKGHIFEWSHTPIMSKAMNKRQNKDICVGDFEKQVNIPLFDYFKCWCENKLSDTRKAQSFNCSHGRICGARLCIEIVPKCRIIPRCALKSEKQHNILSAAADKTKIFHSA